MTHINTAVRLLIAAMLLIAFTFVFPSRVSAQILVEADGVQKETPVQTLAQTNVGNLKLASDKPESHIDITAFYRSPVMKDDFYGISTPFTFYHRGIDYRAKLNSDVHAIFTGVVETVEYEAGGYGRYVIVQHENGVQSLYAHLSKAEVAVGDAVTAETVIGHIGMTGRTTGPHLHFEVRTNTVAINPNLIIPEIE